MKQVRTRFSFLVMVALIAVIAVACGRASPEDIDNALGITSTATLSQEDVAQQTADAVSAAETREAAASAIGSPGSGDGPVDLASAGDPVKGKIAFQQRCLGCHRVGGAGPAPELSGPENPAVAYSDEDLVTMLRTGDGHADPPGPLNETDVNEEQMLNILAYIREQSK